MLMTLTKPHKTLPCILAWHAEAVLHACIRPAMHCMYPEMKNLSALCSG